jgi:hypothetical protein
MRCHGSGHVTGHVDGRTRERAISARAQTGSGSVGLVGRTGTKQRLHMSNAAAVFYIRS